MRVQHLVTLSLAAAIVLSAAIQHWVRGPVVPQRGGPALQTLPATAGDATNAVESPPLCVAIDARWANDGVVVQTPAHMMPRFPGLASGILRRQ